MPHTRDTTKLVFAYQLTKTAPAFWGKCVITKLLLLR